MTDVNQMNFAIARSSDGDAIPIKWGGGQHTPNKMWRNKMVRVSGRDAGHEQVTIITKFSTIQKWCKMNKRDAAQTFKSTWECLKNVDVPKIYNEMGEDWKHFCDDLILFYCARFVLFNVPVPATLN